MSKTKLIWLSLISCNGNNHSFLNYPYLEQFLKDFEFLYHPLFNSKLNLTDLEEENISCDILIIEGSFSNEFKKNRVTSYELINKLSKKTKKIVTAGTCATFGGIFRDSNYSDTTGLLFNKNSPNFIFSSLKERVISISGCPIKPEILANTLYAIKFNKKLKLDKFLRPIEYYTTTIHNGCIRNEYFEYKVDNFEYGKSKGCMFYNNGCHAPYTNGSCNRILWNEVNSKTRVGTPCFGCTENSFPEFNFFTTIKYMGIPAKMPLGVTKRAYLTHTGVVKAFKIDRLEKDLY